MAGIGKTKPLHPDPIVAHWLAAKKLTKQRHSDRWRMAEATATDKKMMVGNGQLHAISPKHLPGWLADANADLKGKPRTKAQKRAYRKHKRNSP